MSILKSIKCFFARKSFPPPQPAKEAVRPTKTYITVKDLDGHTIQIPQENLDRFQRDLASESTRRRHDKQYAEQVAREEEQRAREAAKQLPPPGTQRKDN